MIAAALLLLAAQGATPAEQQQLQGLSATGRATLEAAMRAEQGERQASGVRADAANAAVVAAATRRPFDLAAFRSAIEARDALDAERLRARTRTGVALLEKLSPADREIVAPLIVGAVRPAAADPATAPLPPPTRR